MTSVWGSTFFMSVDAPSLRVEHLSNNLGIIGACLADLHEIFATSGDPKSREASLSRLGSLPIVDLPGVLVNEGHWECAFLVYGLLTNAHLTLSRLKSGDPALAKNEWVLPRALAVPLKACGDHLERVPCLSYTSLVLYNWEVIGRDEGDGVSPVHTFSGTDDEDWFYRVHLRVESLLDPAWVAIAGFMKRLQDPQTVKEAYVHALNDVAQAVENASGVLPSMVTGCNPAVFNTFRQWLSGSAGHTVVFEGCQGFRCVLPGASGAQSAFLQAVDAFLGVKHTHDIFGHSHNAKEHVEFLMDITRGSALPNVLELQKYPDVVVAYNRCVAATCSFRRAHLRMARGFIQVGAPTPTTDFTDRGTGGSNFVNYLSLRFMATVRRTMCAV